MQFDTVYRVGIKVDGWSERICERDELSLEWKTEAVIVYESEGGDCDEVICAGWGEPGGQWTQWGDGKQQETEK